MPRIPDAKTAVQAAPLKKAAARKAPANRAPAKQAPVDRTAAAAGAVKARKPDTPTGSKPHLRFYPSEDLHGRLVALLDQIDESADATSLRVKLSETVRELTAAGLDYYFVRTLKEAKVGFVIQQSAKLGLMGVQQVMAPVVRNVIGRLEHDQLQAIAQSVRQLMK